MPNRYILFGSILFLAIAAFAQDSVSATSAPGAFSGQAHFSAAPPSFGRPVTGAPYSAEETAERVQTLADGTHITQPLNSTKLYRDSSGRTRTERPLMGPRAARRQATQDAPVIVEIDDPVEHVRYTLDTVNKVAHKQIILARRDVTTRRAPPAAKTATTAAPEQASEDRPQRTTEKLDSQVIEGVLVEGTRITTVSPVGSEGNDRPITAMHETWYSPELKRDVLYIHNDPRYGQTTTKLTNISRGEPDPSLFQPPADYQVVEEKGDFTIKWGSEAQ
jgi:hypothetical protein